jgi:hypothetical protein
MTTAKEWKLTLAEMREVVLRELDHLPRWPKEEQGYLRQTYWSWRMRSLGKKATIESSPAAAMKAALASLAQYFPAMKFE